MVAKREDISDLPFWPRLLSTEQAMAYLGTSKTKFSETYKPVLNAITNGRSVRYDIRDIDKMIDNLKNNDLKSGNENKKAVDEDLKKAALDKL